MLLVGFLFWRDKVVKLLHKKYKVSGSYIKTKKPSDFALFQNLFENVKFEIEIAVDGKATVPDVCKYIEKRFAGEDALRILSIEFIGCVEFVELEL